MRRRGFTAKELLVVLGLIVVLMLCAGFTLPLETLLVLGFGWAWFAYQLSQQVTVNVPELIWACIALGLFGFGLHWFCTWFWNTLHAKPENEEQDSEYLPPSSKPPEVAWRPKWTFALVMVILLMFVAGISMVGATHHVAWMIGSQEELVATGVREAARRANSSNRLREQGIGLHNYHDTHGALPSGATADEQGRLLHGWMTAILPFIERATLSEQIDPQLPWNDPTNAAVFRTVVPSYLLRYPQVPAHDANGYAMAGYASNQHVMGGTGPGMKLAEMTDGASHTLLAGEAYGNYKPWGHPRNWRDPALGINQSPDGFGGPRKSGGQMVFADGHVQHLSPDIDPTVLQALATPRGGEPIPQDLP